MTTPAQRWAQKRNWHKARLMGMLAVCHNEIFTRKERLAFHKVHTQLIDLLIDWNSQNYKSKQEYLRM